MSRESMVQETHTKGGAAIHRHRREVTASQSSFLGWATITHPFHPSQSNEMRDLLFNKLTNQHL